MISMSKIVLESRDYAFLQLSPKQIFDDCMHIWSLLKEIASILNPFKISNKFRPNRDFQEHKNIWAK